jgi:hypothetical protein
MGMRDGGRTSGKYSHVVADERALLESCRLYRLAVIRHPDAQPRSRERSPRPVSSRVLYISGTAGYLTNSYPLAAYSTQPIRLPLLDERVEGRRDVRAAADKVEREPSRVGPVDKQGKYLRDVLPLPHSVSTGPASKHVLRTEMLSVRCVRPIAAVPLPDSSRSPPGRTIVHLNFVRLTRSLSARYLYFMYGPMAWRMRSDSALSSSF